MFPTILTCYNSLRYLSDFADEFQLEKLTPPSTRLCLHNGSNLGSFGAGWMDGKPASPPNGRSPRPVEPAPSLARQSPVFEGCDLKWKTLLQLLWRCLECMGFFGVDVWELLLIKVRKSWGLVMSYPILNQEPCSTAGFGSEVNFENLHEEEEEDAYVEYSLPICKELGNLLQRYIPYVCLII